MSNDLISRSAVLDIIKKHERDTCRIAEGVLDLPTAYDVNKVLENVRNIPHGEILNVELEEEIIGIIKAEMKG